MSKNNKQNRIMTQEDKDLLFELLRQANIEDCLRVYEGNSDRLFDIEWIFEDNGKIQIRIESM